MSRFGRLTDLSLLLPLAACSAESGSLEETDYGPEGAPLLLAAPSECPLSEVISPTEFGLTERGAFTTDGRFFVIGARPPTASDAGAWIAEITRDATGYVATNYLPGAFEGTTDGTLDGQPVGETCIFGGMTVYRDTLYASCIADDGRASLLEVDTRARTVRAGAFTTCNRGPAEQPCRELQLYPNGMATDDAGRIYLTDMTAHGVGGTGETEYSLVQVTVDSTAAAAPGELVFSHRGWLRKDLTIDGLAPNGVQIRDGVVYYVGGANVNAVRIRRDGSAGRLRVHFRGPLISYVDDFAMGDGEILLARVIPSGVAAIGEGLIGTSERASCTMPAFGPPSSITYQPDATAGQLFPVGSVVVTSYFGGGVFTLVPPR